MGTLKIIIRKDALNFLVRTSEWYELNMGHTAAQHFVDGIFDTINTLSHSPQIGILDERRSTSKLQYYNFLSHPRYRVVYRFTKTTLYIVAIRATLMKHN